MSDQNNRSLTTQTEDDKPATDIVGKNRKRVDEFMEAGLPGIAEIPHELIAKMADLYLSGKTYDQISMITRTKKDMVLYLSHRMNWFKVRQEYLQELDENMATRIIEAKLVSQDFILQLQQMFHKKIGKKIQRYLTTENEDVANEINLKDIAAYIKTLEALSKSTGAFAEPKAPAVGLNLGEGVTVSKKDDGSVEITPKQKAVGEILKQLADERRKNEKK